ncbi:MAG TPA: hypothetical protein VHB68_09165 [Steroidobacteraceae bacterium]|nr:hypothetical protein [Steroidobacteraceae bacterium]
MRLKSADSEWLPRYAGQVAALARCDPLLAALFDQATLIPVPGSGSPTAEIWAAERLAVALHGVGLGIAVWRGAQRGSPVRKSATALNTDRPTIQQHYESFALHRTARYPRKVVLVDDVITKGRTILALAMRLQEHLPSADIRAFALVRTMGLVADVPRSLDPCHGVVRWAGGDARRDP